MRPARNVRALTGTLRGHFAYWPRGPRANRHVPGKPTILVLASPADDLAEDGGVTDPDDATLAAYESRVQEYLRGSPWPWPELIAFLDRFASLASPGPVLEIGSGPGRDADYLESRGVRVIRTDATPAFVSLLRDAGHDARLLDARTDPLGGPYQGILANAVLLHLNRDQFEDLLRRARAATAPNGVLAFTLKEGDGAAWTEQKLGLPRHFTYWREPAVRAALHCAGWPDASIAHVAGRDNWLHVLAGTSTGKPPGPRTGAADVA
jgi:SAM-dependent methyltransferase